MCPNTHVSTHCPHCVPGVFVSSLLSKMLGALPLWNHRFYRFGNICIDILRYFRVGCQIYVDDSFVFPIDLNQMLILNVHLIILCIKQVLYTEFSTCVALAQKSILYHFIFWIFILYILNYHKKRTKSLLITM